MGSGIYAMQLITIIIYSTIFMEYILFVIAG